MLPEITKYLKMSYIKSKKSPPIGGLFYSSID